LVVVVAVVATGGEACKDGKRVGVLKASRAKGEKQSVWKEAVGKANKRPVELYFEIEL
jgi:hypothetical protein